MAVKSVTVQGKAVGRLRWVSLLTFLGLAIICSGCMSYRLTTTAHATDTLTKDTCKLEVRNTSVSKGRLRFQLIQSGSQEFERITTYDRLVDYSLNVELRWVTDVGEAAYITVPIMATFGICALVVTTATQVPIGAVRAMINPSPESSVVSKPLPKYIASSQDVLIRFGPRMVLSASCDDNGWISINAREFSRRALEQGLDSLKVSVIMDGTWLSTQIHLNHQELQQLAH